MSSITIQWDRVNCRDRNGHINGYSVIYYPTGTDQRGPDARASIIAGTNKRMFGINGLPPLTSYTFEVDAINFQWGPAVIITANTTAPQGK